MSKFDHRQVLGIWRLALVGLALLPLLPATGFCGQEIKAPAGRIVWWGKDEFWKNYYSDHTNGLIECGDEFVTNAIAVAATTWQGLALRSDGTVMSIGHNIFGGDDFPPGLSNVVSVAVEGRNFWAILHDGTVAGWGNDYRRQVGAKVVAGLSNVVSIASGGIWGYLALRKDGTVLGFRLDNPRPWLPQVKVNGEILSNVVALASMGETPLVLKRNGTVYSLGYQTPGKPPVEPSYEVHNNVLYVTYGAESRYVPYQYTTAAPVTINGQVLSNVVAIAGGTSHALALKKNGTVAGWGTDTYGAGKVPAGLSNVVAIAATEHESLALKRNGTVVAWGGDYSHQLSVPAGLSNVVAIASAGDFNLAITTGSIPASVFIQPHGRLEKLAQEADLVFKGQVLSTTPITNAAFRISSMTVNATKFRVISVLKGKATKEVVFEHYSGWRGGAWDGPPPPSIYKFEVGQSYLVFAARMDKPDVYYSPAAGATNIPGMVRQIADVPEGDSDGVTRTLGARPIAGYSVKEAHWVELNRLLKDKNPTNKLYAINNLDRMSQKGWPYGEWSRSSDFKRSRVLDLLLPLVQNKNEQVAFRAMSCFEVTSNAAVMLKPFAGVLIKVANKGRSLARRLAAIRALSGVDDEAVSNSLAQLLRDKDADVRADAVHLLPRFPAAFDEPALREAAKDASPKVRAAVADAIGDGKMVEMLPTLRVLLADPVGLTNPLPPLTLQELQSGGHLWGDSRGDVHTSAGYALLKFDVGDVAGILKAHLNDKGFGPSYLCKLAQNNTKPWLTNLVEVLRVRRERVWKETQDSGIKDTTNYFNALMALSGTYFQCWNIIYDYLDKLPGSAFQDGKLDWCLDVLEDAGNTGSREPVMLYELYRKKGLNERATKFRQENGKCHGFDVTQYFDNVNKSPQ